jgi:hypothetical protein
MLIL